MTKNWREVRKNLSPEAEARIQTRVRDAATIIRLQQLREARNLTQANLAHTLRMNQGSISKMEKKADMYISTLRSYVEAMGGKLTIMAEFDGVPVKIDLLEEIESEAKNHDDQTYATA